MKKLFYFLFFIISFGSCVTVKPVPNTNSTIVTKKPVPVVVKKRTVLFYSPNYRQYRNYNRYYYKPYYRQKRR
jgi:hypothetical protein